MFKNESKLTKYTIIGCALLLIAYFSTDSRAEESDMERDVAFMAGSCAAAQGIAGRDLGTTHESAGRALINESLWWRGFLESWTNDVALSDVAIHKLTARLLTNLKNGTTSADTFVKVVQGCSAAKTEIEEGVEEETKS